MGVQLQENLVSNLGAIYVEGYDDVIALNTVLDILKCKDTIKSEYDIFYAEGASKIPALILSNFTFFNKVYVLIDNDKAGKEAKKVINEAIKVAVVIQTPLIEGYKETELEDLLTLECQATIFSAHYHINFPIDIFQSIKKRYKVKWSEWIPKVFNQVGVEFTDKEIVKQILWKNSKNIQFTESGTTFLTNFIETIRNKAGGS